MKRAALALALTLLPLVGACSYGPGGPGYTGGHTTYVSDPYSPKTITLTDVRNGQVIWTYEVPVGRQLTYQIFTGKDQTVAFPDTMKWVERDAGKGGGELANSMPVPPISMCLFEMKLRATPEYNRPAAATPSASAAK